MNETGNLLLSRTAWLYTKLYEGPVFFFDLWSLAHLYSGFLIMLVLRATRRKHAFRELTALLIAYELLELAFIYVAFHAFRPETLKDQGTDIVVGWCGGLVATVLVRSGALLSGSARKVLVRHTVSWLAAFAIAFGWVGDYGYTYDRPFFNSPGICWWAFLLWTVALACITQFYAALETRTKSAPRALLYTVLAYGFGLFTIEYLGYVAFRIREVGHSERTALAFDLVHGTRGLHVFYLTAPLLGIAVFAILRALLVRAVSRPAERCRTARDAWSVEEHVRSS